MLVSLGLQRVKIGEQNHGERAVLSFLSPLPRGWSRVGAVCAKPRVVTDAAGSAVGRGVGRAPRSRVLPNAGCIENEIGCAARPPSGTAKRSAGNSRSTPLTTPMPAHHPSHPPLRVPSLNRVRPRARPPVPTSGAGTVTDGHPQIVVPSGRERRAGADARIVKRSCQQVRAARLGRCSDSSKGAARRLYGRGARGFCFGERAAVSSCASVARTLRHPWRRGGDDGIRPRVSAGGPATSDVAVVPLATVGVLPDHRRGPRVRALDRPCAVVGGSSCCGRPAGRGGCGPA
jgi:hypothetical protein